MADRSCTISDNLNGSAKRFRRHTFFLNSCADHFLPYTMQNLSWKYVEDWDIQIWPNLPCFIRISGVVVQVKEDENKFKLPLFSHWQGLKVCKHCYFLIASFKFSLPEWLTFCCICLWKRWSAIPFAFSQCISFQVTTKISLFDVRVKRIIKRVTTVAAVTYNRSQPLKLSTYKSQKFSTDTFMLSCNILTSGNFNTLFGYSIWALFSQGNHLCLVSSRGSRLDFLVSQSARCI